MVCLVNLSSCFVIWSSWLPVTNLTSVLIDSTPITEHVPGEEPQTSELTGLFVEKPESTTATKGMKKKFISKMEGAIHLTQTVHLSWLITASHSGCWQERTSLSWLKLTPQTCWGSQTWSGWRGSGWTLAAKLGSTCSSKSPTTGTPRYSCPYTVGRHANSVPDWEWWSV